MQSVIAGVAVSSLYALFSSLRKLIELKLRLRTLLSLSQMTVEELKAVLSAGPPCGVFGQSKSMFVMVEGLLNSPNPLKSYLAPRGEFAVRLQSASRVFSDLNFRKASQRILQRASTKLQSITADLRVLAQGQAIDLQGLRAAWFSPSVGHYEISFVKRTLSFFDKLLVLLNFIVPLRWLCKLVYRGKVSCEYLVRNNSKVLVTGQGLVGPGGSFSISNPKFYKDVVDWIKHHQRKYVFVILKAVLSVLVLVLTLLIYFKIRNSSRRPNSKLQGVAHLKLGKCKKCRTEYKCVFHSPCKHIALCKQCFRVDQRYCAECGQPVQSNEFIYMG